MPRKKPANRTLLTTNPLLKRYLSDVANARGSGRDSKRQDKNQKRHRMHRSNKRLAGDPAHRLVTFGKRRLTQRLGIFENPKRSDNVIMGHNKEVDDGDAEDTVAGIDLDTMLARSRKDAAAKHDSVDEIIKIITSRSGESLPMKRRRDIGVDEVLAEHDCDSLSIDIQRITGRDKGKDFGSSPTQRPIFGQFRRRIAEKLSGAHRTEKNNKNTRKYISTAVDDDDDDDDAKTDVSRWSTGVSTAQRRRQNGGARSSSPFRFANKVARDPPMALIAERVFSALPDLRRFDERSGRRRTYSQRLVQRIRQQMLSTNPYLEQQFKDAIAKANAGAAATTSAAAPATARGDIDETNRAPDISCKATTSKCCDFAMFDETCGDQSNSALRPDFNFTDFDLLPETNGILTDLDNFSAATNPLNSDLQAPFDLTGFGGFSMEQLDTESEQEFQLTNLDLAQDDVIGDVETDMNRFSAKRADRHVTFNLLNPTPTPSPQFFESRSQSILNDIPSIDFRFSRRRMY